MPVIGTAALAVDGEHVRCLGHGGHGGVRRGQVAEVAGEGLLALVVEVDVVEDQCLVLIQGGTQGGDGLGVQGLGDVDAGNLGADVRGDLPDLDLPPCGRVQRGGF